MNTHTHTKEGKEGRRTEAEEQGSNGTNGVIDCRRKVKNEDIWLYAFKTKILAHTSYYLSK